MGNKKPAAGIPATVKAGMFGGLFSGIMDWLKNIPLALSALFSPANLLKSFKSIAKGGLIVWLSGAIFNAFREGWNEYKKSGNFVETLVAGFTGMARVLTLGLFSKERILKIHDALEDAWTNNIYRPIQKLFNDPAFYLKKIGSFFLRIVADLMDLLGKIEIPAIPLTPLFGLLPDSITKHLPKQIGPWKPFATAGGMASNLRDDAKAYTKEAELVHSGAAASLNAQIKQEDFDKKDERSRRLNVVTGGTSGQQVYNQTAENEEMKNAGIGGASPTIIAPSSNTQNNVATTVVKPFVRNTESTLQNYFDRKLTPVGSVNY